MVLIGSRHSCVAQKLSVKEQIEQLKDSRSRVGDQLKSARAAGRLQYTVGKTNELDPMHIIDAEFQVVYQSPKFRIDLAYNERLQENLRNGDEQPGHFQKWVRSRVAKQTILFDGQKVISLETVLPLLKSHQKEVRGTILFGFKKMNVMRSAGMPFEDPISIWNEALQFTNMDERNLKFTSLAGGGLRGVLTKNTYHMKFTLLDESDYDLRRVSSYRTGEAQPFRDYFLRWEKSGGVPFVQRYANVVTYADNATGTGTQEARKLTVEYSQFQANVPIPADAFELKSAGVPEGTRFLDGRSNVNGGPKELIFIGNELVTSTASDSR